MGDSGFVEAAAGEAIESSEGRFVFNVSVPSLQELASYEVALKIWYHFIARPEHKLEKGRPLGDHLRITLGLGHDYRTESDKLVELLGTPRSIEQIIKNCLNTVRCGMDSCIWHFKCDIFTRNLRRYYADIFSPNYCVWHQNGKVDYRKSALKMLSNPELSEIQKFIIMCKYCMEYQISSISANDFPEEFIKEATFEEDFLVFYWICRLKNELDKVPLGNMSSIDAVMAANCKYELWFAFEYFWNRLGANEQISVAVIKLTHSWQFQSILMTKLPSPQQRQLIHRIPVDIILNFWLWLHMPAEAFACWLLTKHIMSEEQFDRIMRAVLRCKISCEFDTRLLIDLWDSASNRLKDYFLRTSENDVIEIFLYAGSHPPSSFRLLCEFLSSKDEVSRKETIINISDKICQINRPHLMMDVVKFCLLSDEEIIQFKKSVTSSFSMLRRCTTLLNNEKFDNLRELLDVYSPDDRTSRELLKRILQSKEFTSHTFILDHRRWKKLSEFIDSTFSNDWSLVSGIKKNILASFAVDCQYMWNEEAALHEMIKVVEMVFEPEKLAAFKLTVLDTFRRIIKGGSYWRNFNRKYCHEFVSWCVGGEEKIDEFKNTISIDDIFDDVFTRVYSWYWNTGCGDIDLYLLYDLEKCLGWYFTNVEEVRKYKICKIYEFNLLLLKEILAKSDKQSLKMLLRWFFDEDQEAIRKFRSEKLRAMTKR